MSWRSHLANVRCVACLVPAAVVAVVLLLAAPGRAGATVITATPVDFSAAEASAFNGAVATFEDDNPAASPADFNASIDWGDGTSTTAGTIGSASAAFTVLGQHTYADEGTFTVTVTINDNPPGSGTATVTDTATVSESDSLSGSPVVFSAVAGTPFTGTVATFSDSDTANVAGDFTATINWGDATTTAGTVSGGSGSFQVTGTHTYAGPGTFSVVVTLSDDAPGTATAQVTSTAKVAASGNAMSSAAVNFTIGEGVLFSGPVATFTDSDATKTPASFSATIAWGDATTTAGTITGGAGSFTVSGQHTYADEGVFTFQVTIAELAPGTASTSTTGTATVNETDVLAPGTPVVVNAFQGVPFSGPVANFTDANTANTPADFTATIDWGDGSPVAAGVVTGGGGSFTVSGTHTYSTISVFSILVTLKEDAPGTAQASVRTTANVVAVPPPPPPTPIPTLDWRGLLTLMLALSAGGFYLLRKGRVQQ
jgi:hypothetical protein